MTYFVNHANTTTPPYTVYDNTTNTETSLKFPGRYVAGYGQAVAENFLHLLENFASDSEPSSPQIGQLWYDTAKGYLRVHSSSGSTVDARWKAASGIEYNAENPGTAVIGQLWVDTANRQLNIYTGSSWMVVGPTISTRDGLKNGATIEEIEDVSNHSRTVLTIYISNIPVAIVSKDTFYPKSGIPGYSKINSGVNLNNPLSIIDKEKFSGGLPQFTGTATAANSLIVNNAVVESSKFLRSDIINNTEHEIHIKHNNGIVIGTAGNLNISYSESSNIARFYNTSSGSIALQTQINGSPKTILTVTGTKVGINTEHPSADLEITGDAVMSGKLTIRGGNGIGLDVTGKVTKGAIVDQTPLNSVELTDQIALYRDGEYISKTTVSNLLSRVQQQSSVQSGLSTRKTLQQKTASIAAGTSIILTLPGGYKGYALYSIVVSSTAWVRVYSSMSAAIAFTEASRIEGTAPAANSGVIAEVSTSMADELVSFAPALIGYSSAATPNTDIIVRVKNKDTVAAEITVKLTILQLEA
jgi:hypothetical protein